MHLNRDRYGTCADVSEDPVKNYEYGRHGDEDDERYAGGHKMG
jgi:hypothetical protein